MCVVLFAMGCNTVDMQSCLSTYVYQTRQLGTKVAEHIYAPNTTFNNVFGKKCCSVVYKLIANGKLLLFYFAT